MNGRGDTWVGGLRGRPWQLRDPGVGDIPDAPVARQEELRRQHRQGRQTRTRVVGEHRRQPFDLGHLEAVLHSERERFGPELPACIEGGGHVGERPFPRELDDGRRPERAPDDPQAAADWSERSWREADGDGDVGAVTGAAEWRRGCPRGGEAPPPPRTDAVATNRGPVAGAGGRRGGTRRDRNRRQLFHGDGVQGLVRPAAGQVPHRPQQRGADRENGGQPAGDQRRQPLLERPVTERPGEPRGHVDRHPARVRDQDEADDDAHRNERQRDDTDRGDTNPANHGLAPIVLRRRACREFSLYKGP